MLCSKYWFLLTHQNRLLQNPADASYVKQNLLFCVDTRRHKHRRMVDARKRARPRFCQSNASSAQPLPQAERSLSFRHRSGTGLALV
jgi:hypothetical protein